MDVFTLWERILAHVRQNDPQYSAMFLKEIFPESFQGGVFTAVVKKEYIASWLQTMYLNKMESIIARETGAPARVHIHCLSTEAVPEPQPAVPSSPFAVSEEKTPFSSSDSAPFPSEDPFPKNAPIDFSSIRPLSVGEANLPKITDVIGPEGSLFPETEKESPEPVPTQVYTETFENFVYGTCNEMAYHSALTVAEMAARKKYDGTFNPLFIYGPSGLGKTHLLRAIQNYLKKNSPSSNVIFMTTEDFVNELIAAIKSSSQEKFRKKYRTVDMLLLDDVQFFSGKDSSAYELFNTFNMLFDNHKNIVMTSDTTPSNIKDLEDRLKSRLSNGFVVQIMPPDFEICAAILERRTEQDGIDMPKEVIEFIASHVHTNVRVLEGAYNSVKAYCSLQRLPFTKENAKAALESSEYIQPEADLSTDRVIDTVCRFYGVSRQKILGTGRPKDIVFPRQMAMYLCRTVLSESFQSIADIFHKKDHTSVIHACNKMQKYIDTDAASKKALAELTGLLKKQ